MESVYEALQYCEDEAELIVRERQEEAAELERELAKLKSP
jgi:hypothetical protein